MKFSTATACLALSTVVSAAALNRNSHQNQRRDDVEIVTVTKVEWDVVTVTEYDLPATSVVAQDSSTVTTATTQDAAAAAATTAAAAVQDASTVAQTQASSTTQVAVVAAPETTPAATTQETTTEQTATPVSTLNPVAAVSAASAAASATPAGSRVDPSTQGDFAGDGTFYELGLTACGQTYTDSDYVAAISYKLFDQDGTANPNNNPKCGKKIRVFRDGQSVDVAIVDRCAGCEGEYDVDLSPAAFNTLATESEGRVSITWSYL